MNKRLYSGCEETSNKPLGSFARWFSGHSSSTGVHSPNQAHPYERFSYRSLVNRSAGKSTLEGVVALSTNNLLTDKLSQMIASVRSQDWLEPLPNLKNASTKRRMATPSAASLGLSLRDEFLMYGSNYLDRRRDVVSVTKEYSRTAMFFAGSLLDRSWVNFDAKLDNRKIRTAALKKTQTQVLPTSAFLSQSMTLCQSFLRRLSMPPSLIHPEAATKQALYDLSRFQFVQQWPLSIAIDPWSTSFQISTAAIVIAIPVVLSAVQIQPNYQKQVANNATSTQGSVASLTTNSVSSSSRTITSVATASAPNAQAAPTAIDQPTQVTGYILNTKAGIVDKETIALSPFGPTNPNTGTLAQPKYMWPAQGYFTSTFGWRWGRMHKGVDIAGPVGTPVRAAADGKVITARWDSTGFGYMIEIQHPDKSVTLYGHNSRILTKVGAKVKQGEQISEMGSTGNSTGPHVHFEVHPNGKEAINPMFFLSQN